MRDDKAPKLSLVELSMAFNNPREFKPDLKHKDTVQAGTEEASKLLSRSSFGRGSKKTITNKFNAKKTPGARNKIYDSGAEAEYSDLLEWQRQAGEIHEWTAQFKLDLIVEGKFICSYRIDFMVMHNDGRMELIEVKGAELADWRRKWDLVKALLPSGLIPNVPNDAKLTLVKKGKRGFESSPQILNYK